MAAEMSVYICNSANQVATARQYLINRGYPEDGISSEAVAVFIYDAVTYDGGKADNLGTKIVVIGRK